MFCACGSPAAAPPEREAARDEHADGREAVELVVDDTVESTRAYEVDGASARAQLVLKGGHVHWIHSTALHSNGRVVALLSIDMPDLGQEMTLPLPYATVTLVDVATGDTRASWRVPSSDVQGQARVRFTPDGARLVLEGAIARRWDLADGRMRSVWVHGWAVPDPNATHLLVQTRDPPHVELRTFDGVESAWSRDLPDHPAWDSVVAVHPRGDRFRRCEHERSAPLRPRGTRARHR